MSKVVELAFLLQVVAKRIGLMEREGVTFVLGVEVGKDIEFSQLKNSHDAVLLATGATLPRDLPIPGRNLKGIHFAMDYLIQSTKKLLDSNQTQTINARGKKVLTLSKLCISD